MTLAFMLTSIASHAQLSTEAQAVINNIMTRASVRGFIEKPVEQDKIDLMLRAAMAAPTDKNKQPWHFVVLNTPETISSYYGDNPRAERMKKTPLVIVVCADTTRMQQGEVRDIWVQDLSASTENLLLAAHALDLGAVWTTIYPLEKRVQDVQQRLNLPDHLIPMCAIRIGYPNPERPAQPKDKWDEQKITYGLWK
jgi:nitroreductase